MVELGKNQSQLTRLELYLASREILEAYKARKYR